MATIILLNHISITMRDQNTNMMSGYRFSITWSPINHYLFKKMSQFQDGQHHFTKSRSINKQDLDISGVVFDGMAVVNEQVVFKDAIKNSKDLADHVMCAVQRKSYSYTGAYVVFDDSSLKETTRKCPGEKSLPN